ncbi:probable G-protein coupled receptor 34b [Hypanus sabinus]|uniref:probable G-protein coupled receptor 34b n=1 Tax=Hypanus sabinus TaxID=79690 RepID=UPI0028C442FA|nr:probable G-protein coupled receptor 34b [Hypanus sabinus]XP_059824257.1 probable G-protein coupled receptor 34b [Hypanus sabinus]
MEIANLSMPPGNERTMEANKTLSQNCSINQDFLMVFLPIMYSFIFLTGLISNVSALLVFFIIQTKKNSIHVYLINMAIADLLLIVCLPFRIAYHANHDQWVLGNTFCRAIGILFYVNMYVSIILLGLISIDRYLKIIKPLQHYKLQDVHISCKTCGMIWFVSILIGIIELWKSSTTNNFNKCFHYREKQHSEVIINLAIVFVFWIVFFLLIISYAKIARRLSNLSREKPELSNKKVFNNVVMKTFIIPFIFTICFVPFHISRFFYIASQLQQGSCYWKNTVNKANEISLLLSAFNSCLDPIMYFLLSKTVRKTILSLIDGKFQKDSRSETT